MGLRFSIEHANWLAHILQPTGTSPNMERNEEVGTLYSFIESFRSNFYASRPESIAMASMLQETYSSLDSGAGVRALQLLRQYVGDLPWVALLLPSGSGGQSDRMLTDPSVLQTFVRMAENDAGWILQLTEPPHNAEISLTNVFPAFKVALADVTRWPGVLVWTSANEAAFFELTEDTKTIMDRLVWLFSRLAGSFGRADLETIKKEFFDLYLARKASPAALKIIHLSDLHLGNKLARRRLMRVQTLIESVTRELGEDCPIVPVITGDLMDTPSEENLGDVRGFIAFLRNLGLEEPIVVLGNHDVREDGWRSPDLAQAVSGVRTTDTDLGS